MVRGIGAVGDEALEVRQRGQDRMGQHAVFNLTPARQSGTVSDVALPARFPQSHVHGGTAVRLAFP